MTANFSSFRKKELINVSDGMKLGFVDDIIFDSESAIVFLKADRGSGGLFEEEGENGEEEKKAAAAFAVPAGAVRCIDDAFHCFDCHGECA